MASAGLKRPSDFELNVSPHGSPNSCWSANKRRCTSFTMQQQQQTMMSPSTSSLSPNQFNQPLQQHHLNTGTQNHMQQNVLQANHFHHPNHSHQPQQPSTSSNSSFSPTTSLFKDSGLILNALSDDVNLMIRNEMHRAQHNQQQHNQKPQTINQFLQNNQATNISADHTDSPVLTVRQTQMICEKLIREREQKLREEYDKILINKLAEQYETFVRYTQDHIEKRYNETNSHQSSYLS